jgi:hypothetical protein
VGRREKIASGALTENFPTQPERAKAATATPAKTRNLARIRPPLKGKLHPQGEAKPKARKVQGIGLSVAVQVHGDLPGKEAGEKGEAKTALKAKA